MNLKIKPFLGTSKNAVMVQLWMVLIYYLLLSCIKFMPKVARSLTTMDRRAKDGLMLDLMELLRKSTDLPDKAGFAQMGFML